MCKWCQDPPPQLLLDGITRFNLGDYYEQHEILEDLWAHEHRNIRRFYQGILQIGVAMFHIQNGNKHGAVYMLERGSNYLLPFTPHCQTVNVTDLLEQATRVLESIKDIAPEKLADFDWSLAPTINRKQP